MNSSRAGPVGCLVVLGGLGGLAGCAVGPNFKAPPPPSVDGYLPQPLPAQTASAQTPGGEAQRFVTGMVIPSDWWTLFESPELNALVERAFKSNPTIESAQAALRQADENYYAQRASWFPTVQAGYSVQRQRNAVGTLAPTLSSGESIFDLHTAQVSVSYVLDVFGGVRRQTESTRSLADAQRYQLEATYLTLATNVATNAIQVAAVRAQLAATDDIVRSEREALQILQKQYELGSIAYTDVMAQEATLATTEATVPALQKQLEQVRHQLATLTGRFPAEAAPEEFDLGTLRLPRDLPVSVPAQLVRQRPDVLAAEAQLHSASAQVGVALANLLPQITLSGAQGGAATQLGQLFAAGNTFWSGGASLTQTLFESGALWHRERAARAGLDEAGAQYRSVVLTAFQNVADSLTALQLDAQAVNDSVRAATAAEQSLITVRRNVELGSTGYLALLNAQQTYQQAVLNLAQARANRYSDTAALFQSLGGGWWNRNPS
ncbi:MAG TPA: efflux transporter outer membrane subunit [Steroidobacteraceae bacterium]|nr:efflux transporter outer membrane subunit [Steroidobacteraceae bacterium]